MTHVTRIHFVLIQAEVLASAEARFGTLRDRLFSSSRAQDTSDTSSASLVSGSNAPPASATATPIGGGLNLQDMSLSDTAHEPSTAASFGYSAGEQTTWLASLPPPLPEAAGLEAQAKLRRRLLDAEGKALLATQQHQLLQNQLVDTKKTVQELLHKVSEQGATIEQLHREASQAQYEVCESIGLFTSCRSLLTLYIPHTQVRHARNKAAELEQQLQETLDSRQKNAHQLKEARMEISRQKSKEGYDRELQAELQAALAAALNAQEELSKCRSALEIAHTERAQMRGALEETGAAKEKVAGERDALADKVMWLHSEVQASREGCEEMEAREQKREGEWEENVRSYNAAIQELQQELVCARDKEGATRTALTIAEDVRASLARAREEQTSYCECLRFQMDHKCTQLSVLSSALQQIEAQRAHGREELRRERERADKCEEALRDVREELVKEEEEAKKLRRACEREVATLRDKEEELLQHRAAAAVNHRSRKEVESELAVGQQELQATLTLHAAATLALEAEEEALHTGVETLLSAMGALQEAVVSQVCERQRERQAASTVCWGLEERLETVKAELQRESAKVEEQGRDVLKLSNNLRDDFQRQLQIEDEKRKGLEDQICQLLLENENARAAASRAQDTMAREEGQARARDVAFAAFQERESVLLCNIHMMEQASARDMQQALLRTRILHEEFAAIKEKGERMVAAAEGDRDQALAQVRQLKEDLTSRELSCEQELSLMRHSDSELQARLAALHMQQAQQALEVAALRENVREVRIREREAAEACRELQRMGREREQEREREREEWRFRNTSMANVAEELGAVVRAGREEILSLQRRVEQLAADGVDARRVMVACRDQVAERERERERERSALEMRVVEVEREREREQEEERAKWAAMRGSWEREKEVMMTELEKLAAHNKALEREREQERERAEARLQEERGGRERERIEEKAVRERERERESESARERAALSENIAGLYSELRALETAMATLSAHKDRETTEKDKLAQRVRQLENADRGAAQTAVQMVLEEHEHEATKRERERAESDWARERAWTRERDKGEREVRYLKETVSSLEQNEMGNKEDLRAALARLRDSEEESLSVREELRRCKMEWEREIEKLTRAFEGAERLREDCELREHKRQREWERERARESERVAALQEFTASEQALRVETKQSLVASIERTFIKDSLLRNPLLTALAFVTWHVDSLRCASVRSCLLDKREKEAWEAERQAMAREKACWQQSDEAAAAARERERKEEERAREEERAAGRKAMEQLRQEAAAAAEAERVCWEMELERERERVASAHGLAQEKAETQRQTLESAITAHTAEVEEARALLGTTEARLRTSEKSMQQLEEALALSEAAARKAAIEAERMAESMARKQERHKQRALPMDICTTRQQLFHSSLHIRHSSQMSAPGNVGSLGASFGGGKGQGVVTWGGSRGGSHSQSTPGGLASAPHDSEYLEFVRASGSPSFSVSLGTPAPGGTLSLLRLSGGGAMVSQGDHVSVGVQRQKGEVDDLSASSWNMSRGEEGGRGQGSLWEKRMRSLALARGITYERAAVTGAWGKKEARQVHLVHHHHHTTSLTPTSIEPAHPVPLPELSVSERARERERELERAREQEKAEEKERERAQALERENEREREQERQRTWEAEAEMEGSALRFQRFLKTPSHELAAGRTNVSGVNSVTSSVTSSRPGAPGDALPLMTSTLSPIGSHETSSESCKVEEAGRKGTGGGREEEEADGGERALLGAGKKGMRKKAGASKVTRTSSSASVRSSSGRH
jgi:hypothetical protein